MQLVQTTLDAEVLAWVKRQAERERNSVASIVRRLVTAGYNVAPAHEKRAAKKARKASKKRKAVRAKRVAKKVAKKRANRSKVASKRRQPTLPGVDVKPRRPRKTVTRKRALSHIEPEAGE